MTIEEKLERDSALLRLEKAERERDEAWQIIASLKDELTLRDERDTARAQRDEAREAAIYVTDLLRAKDPHSGHDEYLWKKYPWLKEQATVDE